MPVKRNWTVMNWEVHGRKPHCAAAQNLYKLQAGSFLCGMTVEMPAAWAGPFLCGMPVELPVRVLYYCPTVAAWVDADGFSR